MVRTLWRFLATISMFLCLVGNFSAAEKQVWWVTGVQQKVTSETVPPADETQQHHLVAARGEYAPFQVIFQAEPGTTISVPVILTKTISFEFQIYEQVFVPLTHIPEPEIFSLARLTEAAAIADGLRPTMNTIVVPETGIAALWVDFYVTLPTPAGDYRLIVSLPGGDSRAITVTVYDVEMPVTTGMSVIVPLESDWTIPHYAPAGAESFQRDVNRLLIDHYLVPGTLTGTPVWDGNGWDFSVYDAELDRLPLGTVFYTPLPFDEQEQRYVLTDSAGRVFPATIFEESEFVVATTQFFADLADYLRAKGRLEDALVYPVDESRWVADEPDHNGPTGYVRLADWARVIRSAGLRVSASRVTPATYAPGWLPSSAVTDDTHVHVDLYDAAPELYAEWSATNERSASLYLNEYGDLIDMPAAIHRGLIWHGYGRGVAMIAGYAAMEWVDENYRLVDPWTEIERLSPKSGYGGGALIWPGPLPSVRLKLLREGIEDARLLDLYGQVVGDDAARAWANQQTPGALADQNPPPDLWDWAHQALLEAIQNKTTVNSKLFPSSLPQYVDETVFVDFDDRGNNDEWEWATGMTVEWVDSPWNKSGEALSVEFAEETPYLFYWMGKTDWQAWDVLLVDVENLSPYFAELDVAVGDDDGNYLLLRNGAILVGPSQQTTLVLPLVVPFGVDESINWETITYIELAVNTQIERTDGFGDDHIYDMGARQLIFDNFRVARLDE